MESITQVPLCEVSTPKCHGGKSLKGAVSTQRYAQLPGKLPLEGPWLGRSGPTKPLAIDPQSAPQRRGGSLWQNAPAPSLK